MTRLATPSRLALRWACLAVVVGSGVLPAGRADEPAGAPEPYVDRVIDPSELPALREERFERFDESGLPRSFFVEGTWGYTEIDGDRNEEHGVAASAFWERPLWGGFSLDGGVYKSGPEGDYTTFGSLWQRGLNLEGGWRVDNGLGVLTAPIPELQRAQYRFFIPVNPILGAVTEWQREDGLRLHAGVGTTGSYTPGRLSGFETDDGYTAALAANWAIAPGWRTAVSLISTDGRDESEFLAGGEGRDGDSAFFALARSGDTTEIQGNLLATRNDDDLGTSESPYGAWVDASTRAGWFLHNYGVFYLRPDLNWGGQSVNSDARGGYYRISHQRMRWTWSASLDHLSPVSSNRDDSSFASGTLRYQLSSKLGIGGSGTYRSAATDAWVANGFVDQRNRVGITRYQLNAAGNDDDESAWEAQLNQTFPTTVGRRLSATVSYGEVERQDRERSGISSLVLFGSQDLAARFSLDGSVRVSSATGRDAQDGYAANLGLNWQFSPHWRLLATYDRSSTSRRNPFVLEPFPEELPSRIDTDIESFFLTLRYSYRAGRPAGVLGGAPGAAAGFIQGSVFLDENDSGMRDAGETGVANITVILNDRFSVRTDSQGNFSFPMVATGSYTLRVLTDNLPLPWNFADDAAVQQVEVRVRQQVNVDFPARR
jgi:hypothetical protein